MSKTIVAAEKAAAAAASSATPVAPPLEGLVRQRDDELDSLRAELELRRRQAAIAARKGLLPAEEATSLVQEKDIAFSYRSSMKTNHAMRLLKEDESGYQQVDKCLACGKAWTDILRDGADNPFKFFQCDERENWNEQRKNSYKNKQKQGW